jgi:hypothetical protein
MTEASVVEILLVVWFIVLILVPLSRMKKEKRFYGEKD